MVLLPESYLKLLKNRDFFILILVVFIGQLASAFLMLSLIISVFLRTASNFGVSGVVLSFTIPGFLLMAFAGLTADIIDRKKIIIIANTIITLVVFLILLSIDKVYASIPLSFLYFAGNSFFIPASSAASGQVVKRGELLTANTTFIFTLSGGIIFGLFLAAIVHFFFGEKVTLVICEVLLILAVFLSAMLPKLPVRKRHGYAILRTLRDIASAFNYIFHQKVIWFFFLIFALVQGIVAFGVTLAPGFFDQIVGLSINISPVFVLPLVGMGIIGGVVLVHNLKFSENAFVVLGTGILGMSNLLIGVLLNFNLITSRLLLIPIAFYLIFLGCGIIILLVASRTVLQKKVSHTFQGTVFGANIILSSFLAGLLSPLAATSEIIFGYVNVLILAGIFFLLLSAFFSRITMSWKF